MASELSIADTISVGKAGVYKSGNGQEQDAAQGGSLVKPTPPVQTAFVTDALEWGNDGGAQTAASLRTVANYLMWLCGRYQLQARYIIYGAGGGTVSPIGPSGDTGVFPIYIKSVDFTNATDYNNPAIVGKNILVFLNEINRYLIPPEVIATGSGFSVQLDGFDATANDYNLIIEKVT